jgi:hypothetical protein
MERGLVIEEEALMIIVVMNADIKLVMEVISSTLMVLL